MKSKQKSKQLYCKIYYSLLAICYLEVLLWTSCLLVSCVTLSAPALDSQHSYLVRETDNLKFAGQDLHAPLPTFETFNETDFHLQLELSSLQLRSDFLDFSTSEVNQPPLGLLRICSDLTGIPAPHSGIQAIS
jgi:hypothetical protein